MKRDGNNLVMLYGLLALIVWCWAMATVLFPPGYRTAPTSPEAGREGQDPAAGMIAPATQPQAPRNGDEAR